MTNEQFRKDLKQSIERVRLEEVNSQSSSKVPYDEYFTFRDYCQIKGLFYFINNHKQLSCEDIEEMIQQNSKTFKTEHQNQIFPEPPKINSNIKSIFKEKELSWKEKEFEKEAKLWGLSAEDKRIAKEERMSPADFIEAEEIDDDELITDE